MDKSFIKGDDMEQVKISEGTLNNWSVVKFDISREESMISMIQMRGRYVTPGTYTKLVHSKRGVIMSDTGAEQRDHYSAVRNAKGSCLVNGLGIGMVLHNILLKPEVTDVTVVEIDSDVIELVAHHYTKDSRVNIVNQSAFDYKPPKGKRYDMVWHDIWDSICQDNYEEMKKLHRKYGRVCDWQGSWGRPEIERMNREDKNRWWR